MLNGSLLEKAANERVAAGGADCSGSRHWLLVQFAVIFTNV